MEYSLGSVAAFIAGSKSAIANKQKLGKKQFKAEKESPNKAGKQKGIHNKNGTNQKASNSLKKKHNSPGYNTLNNTIDEGSLSQFSKQKKQKRKRASLPNIKEVRSETNEENIPSIKNGKKKSKAKQLNNGANDDEDDAPPMKKQKKQQLKQDKDVDNSDLEADENNSDCSDNDHLNLGKEEGSSDTNEQSDKDDSEENDDDNNEPSDDDSEVDDGNDDQLGKDSDSEDDFSAEANDSSSDDDEFLLKEASEGEEEQDASNDSDLSDNSDSKNAEKEEKSSDDGEEEDGSNNDFSDNLDSKQPPTVLKKQKKNKKLKNTKEEEKSLHTKKQKSKATNIKQESLGQSDDSDASDNDGDNVNVTTDAQPKLKNPDFVTIFVGNLPIATTHQKLQKLFSKFGEVKNARIRSIPVADPKVPKKVAAIKKQFHPNRTSVHGYVTFTNRESAEKALAFNGKEYKDHHIQVNISDETQTPDKSKAIFLGNVSFDAEEEELWKLFQSCGEIENVRLVRDRRTNIGKGFGYVNFKSADSVELALQMGEVKLRNRVLRINLYNSQAPKKVIAKQPSKRPNRKKFFKPKHQSKTEGTATAGGQFQGKVATQKKEKKFNKGKQEKKKLAKKIVPKNTS